ALAEDVPATGRLPGRHTLRHGRPRAATAASGGAGRSAPGDRRDGSQPGRRTARRAAHRRRARTRRRCRGGSGPAIVGVLMGEGFATTPAGPLTEDELHRIDAWWRAANYLSVGQIY